MTNRILSISPARPSWSPAGRAGLVTPLRPPSLTLGPPSLSRAGHVAGQLRGRSRPIHLPPGGVGRP